MKLTPNIILIATVLTVVSSGRGSPSGTSAATPSSTPTPPETLDCTALLKNGYTTTSCQEEALNECTKKGYDNYVEAFEEKEGRKYFNACKYFHHRNSCVDVFEHRARNECLEVGSDVCETHGHPRCREKDGELSTGEKEGRNSTSSSKSVNSTKKTTSKTQKKKKKKKKKTATTTTTTTTTTIKKKKKKTTLGKTKLRTTLLRKLWGGAESEREILQIDQARSGRARHRCSTFFGCGGKKKTTTTTRKRKKKATTGGKRKLSSSNLMSNPPSIS